MEYHHTKSLSVSRLISHLVWSIKYRYPVLEGDIQLHRRSLIFQIFEVEGVRILKGLVLEDYVRRHIEYLTPRNINNIGKLLKECTSKKLQVEFPVLKQ